MDNKQTSYNKHYHNTVHKVSQQQFDLISRYRAKKFQPHVKQNDVLLEFGVGNTWNITQVNCQHKFGYDVFIDEEFHRSNITLLTQLNAIPENHFDVIICHHVLEHVDNPLQTLATIKSFLKPNGKLVCHIPYREKDTWQKTFNPNNKNQHLYAWNLQTFCMLLTKAGFGIQSHKIQLTGFDRYAAVLTTTFRLPHLFYGVIRKCLQVVKQDYELLVVVQSL